MMTIIVVVLILCFIPYSVVSKELLRNLGADDDYIADDSVGDDYVADDYVTDEYPEDDGSSGSTTYYTSSGRMDDVRTGQDYYYSPHFDDDVFDDTAMSEGTHGASDEDDYFVSGPHGDDNHNRYSGDYYYAERDMYYKYGEDYGSLKPDEADDTFTLNDDDSIYAAIDHSDRPRMHTDDSVSGIEMARPPGPGMKRRQRANANNILIYAIMACVFALVVLTVGIVTYYFTKIREAEFQRRMTIASSSDGLDRGRSVQMTNVKYDKVGQDDVESPDDDEEDGADEGDDVQEEENETKVEKEADNEV